MVVHKHAWLLSQLWNHKNTWRWIMGRSVTYPMSLYVPSTLVKKNIGQLFQKEWFKWWHQKTIFAFWFQKWPTDGPSYGNKTKMFSIKNVCYQMINCEMFFPIRAKKCKSALLYKPWYYKLPCLDIPTPPHSRVHIVPFLPGTPCICPSCIVNNQKLLTRGLFVPQWLSGSTLVIQHII